MTQNMFPFQAAWYEMEVTTATAIKVAIGAERETQQICFIHGLVVCHNKCFCLMMVHSSTIHGSSSASCTLYPCFMSVPYQGSNTKLSSPTWKAQKEQNKHYIRTWQVKNKTEKRNKLCNE